MTDASPKAPESGYAMLVDTYRTAFLNANEVVFTEHDATTIAQCIAESIGIYLRATNCDDSEFQSNVLEHPEHNTCYDDDYYAYENRVEVRCVKDHYTGGWQGYFPGIVSALVDSFGSDYDKDTAQRVGECMAVKYIEKLRGANCSLFTDEETIAGVFNLAGPLDCISQTKLDVIWDACAPTDGATSAHPLGQHDAGLRF